MSSTLNRALVVKRMAWRLSLRDRNRGGDSLRPLRLPDSEVKKLRYATFRSASACWSTTEDTSPSHARPGVDFASVSARDSAPSVTYASPASCADLRARSPSLNTTRAHPNALASESLLTGRRVEPEVVTKLQTESLIGLMAE